MSDLPKRLWVTFNPVTGRPLVKLSEDKIQASKWPTWDHAEYIRADLHHPTHDNAMAGEAVHRHKHTGRNVILNRASTDLENIVNDHDPEVHHLGNRVWDRLDKMACEIEALNHPTPAPSTDNAAGEEAAARARVAESAFELMKDERDAALARAKKAEAHAEAGWAQQRYWAERYEGAANERDAALSRVREVRAEAFEQGE